MSRAVEYDTLWGFYHNLSVRERPLLPRRSWRCLLPPPRPIRDTMDWVVISRDLLKKSLDLFQQVFPQLYPDIQIGETASFRVKPELKAAYQEFSTKVCGDFYSAGILRYAERWAAMMEDKIEAGATVAEAAEATHHLADTGEYFRLHVWPGREPLIWLLGAWGRAAAAVAGPAEHSHLT